MEENDSEKDCPVPTAQQLSSVAEKRILPLPGLFLPSSASLPAVLGDAALSRAAQCRGDAP